MIDALREARAVPEAMRGASRSPIIAPVLLLLAGCGHLPPVTDPVPGSRPGLSDDPVVVERRSLQAEAGVEAGRQAGSPFTSGELLLRYGILPAAEARIGVAHHGGGPGPATSAAMEDLELGVKLRLAEGGEGSRETAHLLGAGSRW